MPSFAGVAARVDVPPAQQLAAVYYDTAGHDLAAHRITLRRRTGGVDAGWHLKLPGGPGVPGVPGARTEIRAPLGDTAPPELLDVVGAIVRGRPVAPVARIDTLRAVQLLYDADDAVLAEFCDDSVTASADGGPEQRWREWELELVTGDIGVLDRLGERALAAGATPAEHASKLARVLGAGVTPSRAPDPLHRAVAEQLEALLVWDRAVRADADDAVHQMRVTIRKIRSLLQAGGITEPDSGLLDELRRLAGVLGVARDAEVLADRYRRALAGLPPSLVRCQVAHRLVDGAVARYRSGLQQSLSVLRSAAYFQLLDALDTLVAESAAGRAEPAAPDRLGSAYRRVRRAARAAARAAADPSRDEALHRIRKGAKRLRYVAAADGAPRVAERAKTIQTLLGDHQDSVVSRAHLLQQADAAHAAGEDTFTYGLLYQQEADLGQRCRAQLDTALRALAKAVRKGGRAGL